jgi:hypothetical protein
MFSMGRALIATLRYLAQTAINIKEIDLEGLYVFSASHFNDVVQVVVLGQKCPKFSIFSSKFIIFRQKSVFSEHFQL